MGEEREVLKKLSMVVLALAIPLIFIAATVTDADAQGNKPCPKLGYCSPGTCAKDGTQRACNIKNCSKQNCRS
jgi:hypothetical protein